MINKWGSVWIFVSYSDNNWRSFSVLAIISWSISLFSLLLLLSSKSSYFIVNIFWFLLLIPAEIDIQVAVSTLSPVNIHTFIPAFLKLSIVPMTSSCSKSSTPVTHKKSKLFSNLLTTSAIFSFLWSIEALASLYSNSHLSYSLWVNIFWVNTKVLNPFTAKFSAFSFIYPIYSFLTKFIITFSAPFK